MTILGIFLINQIRTGGDRRYIELLELLAEHENNVIVIMNSFLDYTPKYIKQILLSVKYTRHRLPPASYLFKKSIKKYFNTIKAHSELSSIDFIHIHGDIYLKSAIFLKKKLNIPFFYASRCNDIDRARIIRATGKLTAKEYIFSLLNIPINRHREKQISKFSELVTFQNIQDKDIFLSRNMNFTNKTVIIPGNIGLPRCTTASENKNNSKKINKILAVDSTSISKGLLILINVLLCLKNEGYNYLHCTILGRNDDKMLFKYINKYNLSDMVSVDGYRDPFPYFVSHDLLLYPTLYDSYPDTVLEAIHTGCPVLASSVGGLPDMLHYPELLFDPYNMKQIVDKIKQCIENLEYYMNIKKLCKERAIYHHFNWEEKFEKAMSDYILINNKG